MEIDILECEAGLERTVASLIELLRAPEVDKTRASSLLAAAQSQLRFYRLLLLVRIDNTELVRRCIEH